jgi:hypothetical protein
VHLNTIRLLRIPVSLLDLPDEARVHRTPQCSNLQKNATSPVALRSVGCLYDRHERDRDAELSCDAALALRSRAVRVGRQLRV